MASPSTTEAYGTRDSEMDWDGEEEELEIISQNSEPPSRPKASLCPLCLHPLSTPNIIAPPSTSPLNSNQKRLPSYFTLLSSAAPSLASTPRATPRATATTPLSSSSNLREGLDSATFNTGYFSTYFEVEQTLGKGGNGIVFLVRHVLNGEHLGLYACKRINVGDSSPNLLRILREVHLLESLQHPNIITYHHAWVEQGQSTLFSPAVPTLFVLMQYANGGSLDSFISQRLGVDAEAFAAPELSKEERIRRFRFRQSGAVHLLRLDEILAIFKDIVEGLGFLHFKNILHLDLKSENVLLSWDEDALLPRAKLSDFGSSDFTNEAWRRERTGATGTIDWMPPEAWDVDSKTGQVHAPDRSTDQWALGLILHLLCFFTLPYRPGINLAELEIDIRAYPGFFPLDATSLGHGTRHDLPQSLLRIISRLIHRTPSKRPSCEEVLVMMERVRMESSSPSHLTPNGAGTVVSRRSSSPLGFRSTSSNITDSRTAARKVAISPSKISLSVQRKGQLQSQILIVILALLKVVSIQRLCSTSPSSHFILYLILVPTLLDAFLQRYDISLLLCMGHVIVLTTLARQGWCG